MDIFEFPVAKNSKHSPFQAMLFDQEGRPLNFGLIEIGCKPNGKRLQLKSKRELLYKLWGDVYREQTDWTPRIYRTLFHYDPENQGRVDNPKYQPDTIATYNTIDEVLLDKLTKNEDQLEVSMTNNMRNLLNKIIETRDFEKLDWIFKCRHQQELASVRGKLAEILAFSDILDSKPESMEMVTNGYLHYFNRSYRTGTEVDVILTFHGNDAYHDLITDLAKNEYLEIQTN